MIKSTVILFLLITCSLASTAQEISNLEFVGTLLLNDKTLLTYKLVFSKLSNGTITGTSITDIYGSNRTKTTIKGKLNEKNNQISFDEISNVATKSAADENEFCFIHVNKASIRTVDNKTIIQGDFFGQLSNGVSCAKGKLYLISKTTLANLESMYLNNISSAKNDSITMLNNKIKALKEKEKRIELRNENTYTIALTSNEFILKVWDGKDDDQDEIAIFVDERKIQDKLIIGEQIKQFVLPFDKKELLIKITAIGEGKFSPCTANISLTGYDASTELITTILKKGESAYIRVKKQ